MKTCIHGHTLADPCSVCTPAMHEAREASDIEIAAKEEPCPHCGKKGEMTYNSLVNDSHCAHCGNWHDDVLTADESPDIGTGAKQELIAACEMALSYFNHKNDIRKYFSQINQLNSALNSARKEDISAGAQVPQEIRVEDLPF